MKLLVKGKKFEIYMSVVGTWTDPILIMKEGKRQEKMTTSSGELELSLGEFMINDNLIEDLKRVDLMLDEIADQDSIEYIRENIRIFRLRDEYVEKAKKIYHSK